MSESTSGTVPHVAQAALCFVSGLHSIFSCFLWPWTDMHKSM